MRKKMRANHFASNLRVCFLPSVHGRWNHSNQGCQNWCRDGLI
jgi:hypothetical protein